MTRQLDQLVYRAVMMFGPDDKLLKEILDREQCMRLEVAYIISDTTDTRR